MFSKMTWRFIALLPILIIIPRSQGANCSNAGNKTVIHLRAMMTRDTEAAARQVGYVAQAAAEHINDLSGILDDYYICFRFDVVLVSSSSIHKPI